MARRSTLVYLFTVSVCLTGAAVFAQEPPPADPPAHVAFVDGAAVLERDGQIDSDPTSMPLLAGDRLRTQDGRVEVLFADGSTLHLDARTVLDFQSDQVVRLLDGRIRVAIAGPAREVSYRIDAPSAWVQIATPGEYRIAVLRDDEVELAVLRGAAELVNEQGRSYIAAGERTFARAGAAPSPPYVFNSAAWDDFDRWSESRRDMRLGASAQYLPPDVRPYSAAFDAYGSWRYEQQYGYVWYPRVAVGWRPYSRGRWASLRPFGWTWIAGDPWGWPTHHYGRWGISAGAWFWIPGRQWGPAWVSWAYARDYVSWCPLGWNNRPVLQIVNVNVFGGRRYSPWDAWTVIPRRHFNSGYINVPRLASVRVTPRIRESFVVRNTAPDVHYAIGRGAPIRSAGHFAIPRPGAATYGPAAGASRGTTAAERGFPPPARAPRSPSSSLAAPAPGGAAGGRAVARERGASDSTAPRVRGQAAGPDSGAYRRAPQPVGGTSSPAAPVTSAPDGAVRAIPRTRSFESPARPETSTDGGRVREQRAPAYSAPAAPSPARRGSDIDPYRAGPGYRRAPQAGAEYGGRAVPRTAPPSDGGTAVPVPAPSRAPSRESRAPIYSAPASPAAPAPRSVGEGNGYRRSPYRSAPEAAEPRGRAVPRGEPAAPSYRAPERRAPASPSPAAASPAPSRSSDGDRQAAPSRRSSGNGARTGSARNRR